MTLINPYIMKKLLSFLFVLFGLGSVYAAEPDSLLLVENSFRNPTFDKDNCTCKGIPLYGKVEVVTSGADFKVEVVTIGADLQVEPVTIGANRCGQWEFVTIGADFKVEFVTIGADFKIEYVTIGPGIND